jgi:hypothetical protein
MDSAWAWDAMGNQASKQASNATEKVDDGGSFSPIRTKSQILPRPSGLVRIKTKGVD